MKRVAILQARMTSTRLPGKVLMDVAGQPMLVQQIRRLSRCQKVDEIVVATTSNSADAPVVKIARTENVRWFRGSETDVLMRYVGAAKESKADLVVRVTADCPLIDPEESDRVIESLIVHRDRCDYASNVVDRTFPQGLDTEAMFVDTLERIERFAQTPNAREHVTFFLLYEHPEIFRIHSVTDSKNNADLRWTVDVSEDLEMVRRVYEDLDLSGNPVGYREILTYIRTHPEVASLNADIKQKHEAQ